MRLKEENYKIIAALAIGAIGGLILGNYIRDTQITGKPLSKHVAALSKVLKQIEGINTEDAENLKERIQNILKTIESTYGNTKEKRK
jgi:hypothetical protein